MSKLKTEDVIAEFKSLHGDKYDYSKVEYKGSGVKVTIICSKHGEFLLTPNHHKRGVGCKRCSFDGQKITKEEFIEKSRAFFGDKHDYSLFDEMPKFGDKAKIKCNRHNVIFEQETRAHMRGHDGCPKCKSIKHSGIGENRGLVSSPEELSADFAKKASELNGDKYDYSEFIYDGSNTKGKIVCKIHGPFFQSPSNHLRGNQCPKCSLKEKFSGSFKEQCKEKGVDYWRALKRRESGMDESKVFDRGYVRGCRKTNAISVYGNEYPNIEEACRALNPSASSTTIGRLLRKGVSSETAFAHVTNPTFSGGVIYRITHKETGKTYVGMTSQLIENRFNDHIFEAKSKKLLRQDSLHAAIRKYGPDAFEVLEIEKSDNLDILKERERYWIERLGTNQPNGFNVSKGGEMCGSWGKPTVVDGMEFESVRKAAKHVAETRGISECASEARIRNGRINVKNKAKAGESLVYTKVYKAWSFMVHCAGNPKSNGYINGITIHEPWRSFEQFLKDVGHAPGPDYAFTRSDKSKGFYPENCSWMCKSDSRKLSSEWSHSRNSGNHVTVVNE